MTASEVRAKLRDRYPLPEWVSAAEVADSTGFHRRRCDFLAMNCYPSKGLAVHGHEIKVARSDWLKEIQDPEKAATFQRRCHYWWIVAPKGVLELAELPEGWGYMLATEKSLRVKKAAALREPDQLDYGWVASIVRSVQENAPADAELAAAKQQAYERGWDAGKKRGDRQANNDSTTLQREAARLRRAIDEFEAASGVKIKGYQGASLGAAVALVLSMSGRHDATVEERIDESIRAARRGVEAIEALRKARELMLADSQLPTT